jgi:hypothetical protein
MRSSFSRLLPLLLITAACSAPSPAPAPARASGDAAFTEVARAYLEDTYQRQPVLATLLGIHKHDERSAIRRSRRSPPRFAALRTFRERAAALDCVDSDGQQSARPEQMLLAIDGRILTLETVRPWARDPDSYSSGITNAAYIMIKRAFAPPEERLRHLIARQKAMPAVLAEARKNLDNPARIHTEIAIEQMTATADFFTTAVAAAFPGVTDKALLADFKQSNDAVIAALNDYKKWLKEDLLKRSNGSFAIGEETFRKKLAADEMITLLARRSAGHRREGLTEESGGVRRYGTPHRREVDADAGAREGAGELPSGGKASVHDAERARCARRVHDRPPSRDDPEGAAGHGPGDAAVPARDDERVDGNPGPFETVATEAYYNMTLPDPKASAKDTRSS